MESDRGIEIMVDLRYQGGGEENQNSEEEESVLGDKLVQDSEDQSQAGVSHPKAEWKQKGESRNDLSKNLRGEGY
ncbi:hypothetical protein Q3G72_030935 [Acer saccharum]|nr:hypothetical protein Q3G72_030935 [Acer saccharum]